ncbi:MAG: radical SAM-associated putative lipoprotein [Tannerellaceae bacterium]|nr:radical SAM-associated putative lipoprotein [Tannerellaceae bacterium]
MKMLSHLFTKHTSWLFPCLLSLLGFSCSDSDDPEPLICEYGSPFAHFAIKGKVVSETDQKALPDMQVIINYDSQIRDSTYATYFRDTLYTDINGDFEWDTHDITLYHMPVKIITSDPDTLSGTTFAPDTTLVTFESSDMQNAERWFEGEAEKEITIALKPVSGEDEASKEGEK